MISGVGVLPHRKRILAIWYTREVDRTGDGPIHTTLIDMAIIIITCCWTRSATAASTLRTQYILTHRFVPLCCYATRVSPGATQHTAHPTHFIYPHCVCMRPWIVICRCEVAFVRRDARVSLSVSESLGLLETFAIYNAVGNTVISIWATNRGVDVATWFHG